MRRPVIAATVAAALVVGVALVASAAPVSSPGFLECYSGFTGTPIEGGVRLECVPDATVPPTTAPATTAPPTTAPVTTAPVTEPPTTAVAPTTTTQAPTTTVAPTTTTTTTQPPAPSGDFVETFAGNTGFERFDWGIYHRGDERKIASWQGDHSLACGDPSTQRTIHYDVPAESFYLCADHLMTSVADAAGYSIAWFEPAQTFTASDTTTVSWDVSVSDLLSRQWWEVVITPADYHSGVPACPHCTAVPAVPSGVPDYPPGSVTIGLGPFAQPQVPGKEWWFNYFCLYGDPEGCASKTIRRTISVTDNRDGTVTTRWDVGTQVRVFTGPGSFPDEFRVVFKDHNYTPDKDGTPVGHTWHWDSIAIS